MVRIAPTGKEVTYSILAIYRIENGRIAEDWHIFYSIALWQTLIPEIKTLIEEAMKAKPPINSSVER